MDTQPQSNANTDWIADALREHAERDKRLVEIATIQVLLGRRYRGATDHISHLNYFKGEIERCCAATVSDGLIDGILERRRQQFGVRV